MFVSGTGSSGLAVITDARTKTCADVDGCLDFWRPRAYLGAAPWQTVLRIALRDFDEPPQDIRAIRLEKPSVERLLVERKINTLVLMQTSAFPGEIVRHSAWNMYGRPGSPFKWAGCVWEEEGRYLCPMLNPQSYEHVYEWLIRRWFQQAYAVAQGALRPYQWPELVTQVGSQMLATLERIGQDPSDPVAVDIETNMGGGIITAIGFSNTSGTVSIPWDEFRVSGTDDTEPGLASYPESTQIEQAARCILASNQPLIFHNGAFDIFELSARDIVCNNFAYDTLLMHRVAYPQYKHGLQFAAATEFVVEPWKCFWKPPKHVKASRGDDIWLSDPKEMHRYNCRDANATYQIYQSLKWKVGL